ncbi:aminotransferase [Candidatus Izimaplasma bacterium ZiA1]|uniref:pyridoxal-phosphate-dependent aminotransferase family protein n=1 Tax=Candidatus Izimoplasma sp. ZiA1 TaxID=2024899 RepID=UPI000BAA753A|nr:aminotransferase [Candidatus Izimaplasma bacterium ZiA1]
MKNQKLCMIPGPTPVVRSIQDEMGRETVSFKDPSFVEDFLSVIKDMKNLWSSEEAFVISGSGTLAMEMAIANTLKEGDNCLVISHGYFGDRFIDMLKKRRINVDVMNSKWGQTVCVSDIKQKLRGKTYQAVTVTHVDTSTGVRANIIEIGKAVYDLENTLLIVDGVCSTAAEKENLKEMNIDILLSASQKAFGVAPGLALLWTSQKAMKRREELGEIRDTYLDFYKWLPIMHNPMKYFGTPPVNLIWALKESLSIIKKEGLDNRFNRHIKDSKRIREALIELGFGVLADEESQASTLTNVLYPDGFDDTLFRQELANQGVVVAGGLGDYAGKLFRLGHMGNIDEHTIFSTISAIERVLIKMGKTEQIGKGLNKLLS